MNEHYTYTDAFEELQTIVSEIERGEISIDELSEKVKRAALLIQVCKAKLTATEQEVNGILAELAAESVVEQPSEKDDAADAETPDSPDEDEADEV